MTSYSTQKVKANSWFDITNVTDGDINLANTAISLINDGPGRIRVFEGGVSQPISEIDGPQLNVGDSINVNAANIWVRGVDRDFTISFTDTK